MVSKQIVKVTLVLMAILAVAFFLFNSSPSKLVEGPVNAKQNRQTVVESFVPSAPIKTPIRGPNVVVLQPQSAVHIQTPSLAKLRLALVQATDFLLFKQSLDKMTDISLADKAYYTAAIDESCFGIAASNGWVEAPPILLITKNAATPVSQGGGGRVFQPEDPKQYFRKQAFDRLDANAGTVRCAGYKTKPITFADVERGWKAAAATGDPRSIAALADLELRKSSKQWSELASVQVGLDTLEKGGVLATPNPTAEHIVNITRALSTGDPSAIISLGASLSQTYDSGKFTYGQNNETFNKGLEPVFWQMLACSFGFDCGAANSTLLSACANGGLCEVQDLETYYKGYRLTAEEVAQYERLKPIFVNAIKSGDWAFLRFQSPVPSGGYNLLQWNRRPYRLGV